MPPGTDNRRGRRNGSPDATLALVDVAQPEPVTRRPLPPGHSWCPRVQRRCHRLHARRVPVTEHHPTFRLRRAASGSLTGRHRLDGSHSAQETDDLPGVTPRIPPPRERPRSSIPSSSLVLCRSQPASQRRDSAIADVVPCQPNALQRGLQPGV